MNWTDLVNKGCTDKFEISNSASRTAALRFEPMYGNISAKVIYYGSGGPDEPSFTVKASKGGMPFEVWVNHGWRIHNELLIQDWNSFMSEFAASATAEQVEALHTLWGYHSGILMWGLWEE